ncbi:hypothetical protein DD565_16870 [Vibrio cholerae]|nr:hypothetical protein [Vibrio cholerae]PVX16193.1 hypothetical protein DD565_16870 [Vibrio cholerae]
MATKSIEMRKTRRHWGIDTVMRTMKPMKRAADLADNICLKAPRDETLSSKVNVIAHKLNSRPRARLGFKTPEECFVGYYR